MRVSINKSTGKMIESQSGGETHPDPKINDKAYAVTNLETLRQNALNAGYNLKDVEVKFVTDEEFEVLLEVSKPEPTEEQLNEDKIKFRMREIAIDSLKSEGKLPVDYEDPYAIEKNIVE